jgi:transcriptional regulator with XRE-family HTH domain
VSLDLTLWTPGERLWLWRLDQGLSQRAAARRLKTSRTTLYQAEHDRAALPRQLRHPATRGWLLHRLARRRSGTSATALARALGVSRVTLNAWERADDPRLRAWWERQGYRLT